MAEGARPRVGITGATGYVGRFVRARFEQAGWNVVSLSRPSTISQVLGEARRFSLGEPVDSAMLRDLDVLIHCAWDLTLTSRHAIGAVNVTGTRRLMEAATEARVARVVFVSSMSAYENTSQLYGQSKLECERIVADAGGVSVRPGLVYGDSRGGMAGALSRLVSLPIVPLLGGAAQYTVHEDDVAEAVFAIATSSPESGALGLAHPDAVPLRCLLEGLANRLRIRPHFAPVPWRPVYLAMRAAELARIPLPLRADSLLGVVRPAPFVPRSDVWARHGVSIRPFAP